MTNGAETYIQNTTLEELIFNIEENDSKWMTDPWEIKERYLHHQSFLPHFDQYRYVFEQMLQNTASVDFTHHTVHEQKSNSPIRYSNVNIRNIITPQKWGTALNQCKTLAAHDQKYNYWDYQKGFYNAFYYQNSVRTHSWFFKFYLHGSLLGGIILALTWIFLPKLVEEDCKNWIAIYLTLPGKQNTLTSK